MHISHRLYQIRVRGHLDPSWSSRLNGMAIEHLGADGERSSTLTGELEDQSALSGVLNALFDIQVVVLSVDRLEGVSVTGDR